MQPQRRVWNELMRDTPLFFPQPDAETMPGTVDHLLIDSIGRVGQFYTQEDLHQKLDRQKVTLERLLERFIING